MGMEADSQLVTDTAQTFGDPVNATAEAEAEWIPENVFFKVKRAVPADAEIKVASLPYKAQRLFLDDPARIS